jgi:hypothetical protein
VSALPSVQARLLAFAAILVAGVSGGLIGSSAVKVGCQGSCATPEGIGGVVGAVTAAGGVAVIAVLVLRAMGEWRSIKEQRELDTLIAAAGAAVSTGPSPPAPPPLPAPPTLPPPLAPPAPPAPPGGGHDEDAVLGDGEADPP